MTDKQPCALGVPVTKDQVIWLAEESFCQARFEDGEGVMPSELLAQLRSGERCIEIYDDEGAEREILDFLNAYLKAHPRQPPFEMVSWSGLVDAAFMADDVAGLKASAVRSYVHYWARHWCEMEGWEY